MGYQHVAFTSVHERAVLDAADQVWLSEVRTRSSVAAAWESDLGKAEVAAEHSEAQVNI